MGFVNPLFFIGMFAAGIPVLLHLIKRERAKRIEFPTLMFLRRISKKTIRYQKLRHLLLLLVRILALLSLVLAFLRPYRTFSSSVNAAGHATSAHVIMLDNSMSMGFGDRWNRARSAAEEIAARSLPGDRVALLEFSDWTDLLTQLTDDFPGVIDEIRHDTDLTDRPTRYAQALRIAEKVALDAGTVRRVLHLISDFQKSGWAAEEQAFRLGAGIELERIDVGSAGFSNLTVGDVHVMAMGDGNAAGLKIKYSLVNYGNEDRKNVRVSFLLDGRSAMEKTVDIGRGEVQAGEFQIPGLTVGAHQAVIEVEDSKLSRDNRYYLMLEARDRTQVLSVEDAASPGGARSPSYFLSRALNVSALSRYQLTSVPPARLESSAGLSSSLIIWNDAPGGGQGVQKKLEEIVRGGGGLIVVVSERSRPAEFNRTFGSWLPVRLEPQPEGRRGYGRSGEEYSLLTDLRMDHPIFRPFSEPHSGSFSSARFYRHARLTLLEGADALAHFDNGDPALITTNLEKGRVLIFASSADDSSNDLPLKAVYAPLWQQMLRFLDNVSEQRLAVEVGSTISPRKQLLEAALRSGKSSLDLNQAIVVLDASKKRLPMAPGSDAVTMERVGFCEIRAANQIASVAVNPVPRESDLTHGNSEEMVAGWMSHDTNSPSIRTDDEQPTAEDLDRRHRLWRYFVFAALIFLLGEVLLSNRFVLRTE